MTLSSDSPRFLAHSLLRLTPFFLSKQLETKSGFQKPPVSECTNELLVTLTIVADIDKTQGSARMSETSLRPADRGSRVIEALADYPARCRSPALACPSLARQDPGKEWKRLDLKDHLNMYIYDDCREYMYIMHAYYIYSKTVKTVCLSHSSCHS